MSLDLLIEILAQHASKGLAVALLFSFSLLFRFLLIVFGQNWIKTKAHTATIILLPVITYVITNVISGNIALSLGMVGALSIVRFRNPVRSPLELAAYFGAITMGIAAAVSLQWLLFLVGSLLFCILGMAALDKFCSCLLGHELFTASFIEGNPLSTLTVKARGNVEFFDSHHLMQSKIRTDNEVCYFFAASNFEVLKDLEASDEVRNLSSVVELKK